MATASAEADKRAQQALALLDKGDFEQAQRVLREAIALDQSNETVKFAWEQLQNEGEGPALVSLSRKWLETKRDEDGEAVMEYLTAHPSAAPGTVAETMRVLLQYDGDADIADEITGELLKRQAAREVLTKALVDKPTVTCNNMFERGDDSFDGQSSLLLNPAAWASEKERIAAERDVFQLALAQLMRAGQDFPERAMKAIARLLGAEAQNLNGLIDADGFDVLLSHLDIRLPALLRSQATLACVKLLELSPDTAKILITQFVVTRIEKPTAERLVQAFSAAAAVFPMAPQAAAELFLTSGFLTSFVKLVHKFKSYRVEQAALQLLNAACMDAKCREAILKYCPEWLEKMTATGTPTDERRMSQVTTANLVLEKIRNLRTDGEKVSDADEAQAQEERLNRFRAVIVNPNSDEHSRANALEGLAFASIKSKVKEQLANDQEFLKGLVAIMGDDKANSTTTFGGLTIISNLTSYRPVLSEEQKKLTELKAYANSEKPGAPDPLDDDSKVSARCNNVVKAGIVPVVVQHFKSFSSTSLSLALAIINSLSKEKDHRGLLAQQGALRFLLLAYDKILISTTSPDTTTAARTAAHAIARILITVNPTHAFATSTPPMTSAIRPLSSLLIPEESDSSRNLLPTFEALLALTNLASTSDSTCTTIVRFAFPAVDDLLLSSHSLTQRAAAELACNLSAAPSGAALFAGAGQAATRLHIMLALSDAEDLATRRAAAGALAMLTDWDGVVDSLVASQGGIAHLWRMVADEAGEVRFRGIVALRNCVCMAGEVGERAREKVRSDGGYARRLEAAFRGGDDAVKEVVGEIVKAVGGKGG